MLGGAILTQSMEWVGVAAVDVLAESRFDELALELAGDVESAGNSKCDDGVWPGVAKSQTAPSATTMAMPIAKIKVFMVCFYEAICGR